MRKTLKERVLAFALILAMLLPDLAGVMPAVQADTITAEPNVYDISDLTGSKTNTIKGTDETWEGQIHANVKEEHKENIVFKTKLTMGQQQVRLALNAKEGTSIFDPPGYAVYINHNGGAPYIAIKRNQQDLVVGSVAAVEGTWELEIGIVDILTDGVRTGKHVYVKKDGQVICEADDTNGYLTGDALGTKIIDFHYGAAIQMDSTYTDEYAGATVYDISDLTGSETNTVTGTGNDNWSGVILGAVSEEHKENMAFKTKLTMGAQEVRLSLNAKEGASVWDPPGYAVYINHNNGAPYVAIRRNNSDLAVGSVSAVAGTCVFEAGIVDIVAGGNRIGKHLYVKMDDVIVCEYDDVDGYLTGDALGTNIVDFHYGAAIQMDTTKDPGATEPDTTEPDTSEPTNEYGAATIYDIYDLTGSETNTVTGTGNDNWSGVILGAVSEEHKENMAFKTKLTMGQQEVRLSLNAKQGASVWDPPGYAVYINHNNGAPYVSIRRNNSDLAVGSVSTVAGTCVFEAGIVDILVDGNPVGKHLYVKMDNVIVCEYDDMDGYLTGDALGTNIVDFHYGAAIQMDTTKEPGATEPETTEPETTEPETTEPETTEPDNGKEYGAATIYDIYDLTGFETNTIKGTNDTWDGQIHAHIHEAHKENMAFKTKLTMGAQQVRLSLNAKEGANIFDPPGYAVYLYGEDNAVEIRRNNMSLQAASVQGVAGTYILEVGIVDILQDGSRIGKHLYVKMDDVIVCEYDDMDGYLTGDALGTKVIDFHYGAAIQMDTTKEPGATEPETTEPETTEPESGSQTVVDGMVYDVKDLTGSAENTYYGAQASTLGIPGVEDNWVDSVIGNVKPEDKENIVFKTKLTVDAVRTDGADTLRLSIGLTEDATALDFKGYSLRVRVDDLDGKTYFGLYRNGENLAYWEEETAIGTYELEFGIQSILEEDQLVGKRITLKKDGQILKTYDDFNGFLTGESLGTKIAIFHYVGKVVMESTKPAVPQTYADATVYDIKDLTGIAENTYYGAQASTLGIPGVEDNWVDSVIGNVKPEDKENIVFKTKLTVDAVRTDGADTLRLSIGLTEDATALDFKGYSLRVRVDDLDGKTYFGLYRNGENLAYWEEETAIGTYELEFGIQSILEEDQLVGKRITLKKDGQILKTYDDFNGFLTGDALGTKIAIFHYVGKVVMESTKPAVPQTLADAKVYDIYDLTGVVSNIVKGTDDTWEGQIFADVKPEHKENVAIKTKLTMGAQQVRLSFNAKEGADIYDPQGYAVYLFGETDVVEIRRNNATLKSASVQGVAGTYILELGLVDILAGGNRIGKHLYVKIDDVVVCEYDDYNGYLTGDDLGTTFIDFHYGAAIQMETTYDSGYGEAKVYDLEELTGETQISVDPWIPTKLGDIAEGHKEQAAIELKMNITDARHRYRFSVGAPEGADCTDPQGYGLEIAVQFDGVNHVRFTRGNGSEIAYFDDVSKLIGEHTIQFGYRNVLLDGGVVGKQVYLSVDGQILYTCDDGLGYLTGDNLGTMVALHHIDEGAAQLYSKDYIPPEVPEYGALTAADPTVYDLNALMGTAQVTVPGQLQGVWGTTLGHVNEAHKNNVAFASDMDIDEAQTILLGLGLADLSMAVQLNSGYVLEIVNKTGDGELDTVKLHRAGVQIYCKDQSVDFNGKHAFEYGMVDLLADNKVVGKRLYVKLDGKEVFHYDDQLGFLTAEQTGTKIEIYASGNDLLLGSVRNLTAGEPQIYDLYDMQGVEQLTLTGRESDPEKWGTTLGNVLPEHKNNVAFKTTVTMDEAQTVMLGLGLADTSMAVLLNSGYVLEIVTKTGKDEADTVKLHRAGEQIYCKDQTIDFNGEYELEFGVVELYDQDLNGAVVGKRIYVKVNGELVLYYDDTVNALTDDQLGTKVDVFVSGKKLQMASIRGYQAKKPAVYDLYDLAFRETVEVDHKDDKGDVIWGVLIGNVEEAHKGNVALKTKVQLSKDQQQNLLIGLGLKGHWPVSGGFGYQIELIADPENKTDSLRIYKNANPEGGEPVGCYNAEQSFDFNGSFELEVGVVDLLDGKKNIVARRIYVIVDGQELMHYDDTKNVVSGEDMGTVVAAYVSSGTAILGTCVDSIPSTDVKVYDIYDLLGRASVKLNRTDAGGAVVWNNILGEITDTNNMNYALRVHMDTGSVDRSSLQELILGLCKESELFDKAGYRLSMYFAVDGGTSLVLRDSATDAVLASADGVFPASYELEIGITDFFGSNKELLGKKIYLKIDGKEVLAYLDKDTGRVRGNLLCAYTTSPITVTTQYGYCTIPVTYVVNGEKVDSSKYITSNTDVIAGKKSIIDVALGNKDEFTSVLMKQVLLNGKPISPVSDKQDVYVFELESPGEKDELTVEIEVHTLTVDEAQVYDLYELTGKKEIVIPANSVDQIGTLFADGQEGVLNRAIRFAYYIPATGGGLRLGYGSDTSDIWSRTGTHIEIWCGFATISHGFHVSALSSGNTDIFKADSWSVVEVGIVKCYEDGVYKYDRWYVKAGETAEEMELITYYDSTQRHDSTLNIMARTPDTGDDFKLTSTLEVRSVTDVSEQEDKENATVAFKPLFLKGESVKLVVFPAEGKTLESLTVNGEQVKAALTSDGGYVYTLENAQEDVAFGYTICNDESLYNITADSADHLEVIPDQTAVAAGGSVTVQIKVDGGYILKSLLVNDVDFLPMARYDKTTLTYTLTITGIREDKHIQAQAEKVSQEGPVADGATEEKENTNLPTVIAVAVLCVAVLGGVVAVVATRAKKKGRKQ